MNETRYLLVYTEARVDEPFDQRTPLSVNQMQEIGQADVVIVVGPDGSRVIKARYHDPQTCVVTEIATPTRGGALPRC